MSSMKSLYSDPFHKHSIINQKCINAHSKQDVCTHSFAMRYDRFLVFVLSVPAVQFYTPAITHIHRDEICSYADDDTIR